MNIYVYISYEINGAARMEIKLKGEMTLADIRQALKKVSVPRKG